MGLACRFVGSDKIIFRARKGIFSNKVAYSAHSFLARPNGRDDGLGKSQLSYLMALVRKGREAFRLVAEHMRLFLTRAS